MYWLYWLTWHYRPEAFRQRMDDLWSRDDNSWIYTHLVHCWLSEESLCPVCRTEALADDVQ